MNMKILVLRGILFIGVVSTLSVLALSHLQIMVKDQDRLQKTTASPGLIQVQKTVERLKSEIAELEELEQKTKDRNLGRALEVGVQLQQKQKQYGSLETLQANLRVLNEIKSDIELRESAGLKTSAVESL